MQYRFLCATAAVFLAAVAARADLTVRYKTVVSAGSAMPPEAATIIKQQLAAAIADESSIQIKGSKVRSRSGRLLCIADYAKGEMAVLDADGKRFSAIPLSEFASRVNALVPGAAREALKQIAFDLKSERTGRSATILNVPAAETIFILSMDMPGDAGPAIGIRMELHTWAVTPEGLAKVPALREWNGKWRAMGGWDPAETLGATFARVPGAAEKLASAVREAGDAPLNLRVESRLFMPFLVSMMKAQGLTTGEGPIAESTMEVASFSSGLLPDGLFEVPADYRAVSFEEVIQASQPKTQLPAILPRDPQ